MTFCLDDFDFFFLFFGRRGNYFFLVKEETPTFSFQFIMSCKMKQWVFLEKELWKISFILLDEKVSIYCKFLHLLVDTGEPGCWIAVRSVFSFMRNCPQLCPQRSHWPAFSPAPRPRQHVVLSTFHILERCFNFWSLVTCDGGRLSYA